MIQVHIARQFDVRTADGRRLNADELHAEGERLMQALLDLEQCNDDFCDSVTATDADMGTVLVELLISDETETGAFDKSRTIVRTAIHAIGGHTPWDVSAESGADYRPRDVQLEYV
ncbi:hypothetical protein O7623_23100 [Solwaraspora sp. WMMD791]|uniref:hypothetical protein n=1 Tax=Solwaraspora sp. WMMD791 TaxID=3016086 RepID=UPI00249A7EFA|nr:hypothetical protein [Solwaraspora sp. WMMD791]WFE26212.1 hypothetical protein O7623_23100 [Solwaraspora sp. WMMD791]